MFYRYQEWYEGLHNFDDHIILSVHLRLTIRNALQVRTQKWGNTLCLMKYLSHYTRHTHHTAIHTLTSLFVHILLKQDSVILSNFQQINVTRNVCIGVSDLNLKVSSKSEIRFLI